MNTTTLHPELATAYITARKDEAERIARLDGHGISSHSADWTMFDLDDDLADEERNATWRTMFIWEDFRFEGHVYDVRSAAHKELAWER